MGGELEHQESSETRNRVAREAADLWLRARASPSDLALRREIDEWCAQSPFHERAFSAAAEAWALAGVPATTAPSPHLARRRTGKPWRSRPRRAIATIVSAAAAACFALVAAPTLLLAWQSDYRTGTGEIRSVTLSDGSSVTLDTGTAIALDYSNGRRGVRLLAGRAWFDVAHDEAHPFVVSADDVSVTVTGTAFDVGLDDDSIDVALARGGVRVGWDGATPIVLTRGDRLHIARLSHSIARDRSVTSSMDSWRQGRLLLENVPLSEGIDQLRRYYSGAIVLTSSELGQRRVTGVFEVDQPDDALRLMVRQHGASVREITPWLLVVSER